MAFRGATVDSITRAPDGGCRVAWHYDGRLEVPSCDTMWWQPGPRDAEDAANLALAMLLPMVTSIGEGVRLPYAISRQSLEFWEAKLGALQRFYHIPVQVDIAPIGLHNAMQREGDGVALMFGGGVDSCAMLGKMLDSGKKPTLIRLAGGEKLKGKSMECYRRVAKYAGVPLRRVETNAGTVYVKLCKAWSQHWRASDPIFYTFQFKRNRDKLSIAPLYLTHGFKLFFSALGALPLHATRLLYSWATDAASDIGERHGNGFCFYNDLPYRGIQMMPRTAGTKPEAYAYLHKRHPTIYENVKACPHDKRQWCGACSKCVDAHIAQAAAGLPRVEIAPTALRKMHYVTRIVSALMHYHVSGREEPDTERFLFEQLARAAKEACG